MIITFKPEGGSDHFDPYYEQCRQRLVKAIGDGIRQAMTNLAQFVVSDKLSGSVVQRRTGRLADAVLNSVRVSVNQEAVRGSITARPSGMPNEGYWQEFGTHHPALADKLRMFVAPDGTMVFTDKTREFSIAPKPFMNPSLRENQTQIFETIRARVAEAQL